MISCGVEKHSEETTNREPVLKEIYQTERNEDNNVDSPSIWHGPNGEHWLIATAKATDVLNVYNAEDGSFIKKVCETGAEAGQLKRPNGIAVIDNYAVIVERDNHRVQVFSLPEFKSLGFFGENNLIKPYGLTIFKDSTNSYNLFVTDNYETKEETAPPDSLLNKRIHNYKFSIAKEKINYEYIKSFGDTSGKGILRIVESIYADTLNKKLLIAEEDTSESSVKVYDLNGNFTGEVFGIGLFKHQVEGITLYECENGKGYWIITDQDLNDNSFLVFDRKTFNYVGSFKGNNTSNTDGVWLTQTSFGNFSKGVFFAIHNDGNVSAFDLNEIADSLELNLECK